jgi:hypothetical protein
VRSDIGPTIEKIVGLSALTTLKVNVADAVVSELPGRTGSVRAILIVKGDVTLGVDLSGAVFEQVDQNNRRAVLHLPQPTVQSVRLDHEKTKLVGVWESGLWTIIPGGEDADTAAVNRAMRDAQRIVAAAGQDPELIQRCRVQTEEMLEAFLKALGWGIEVQFIRP